MPYLHHVSDLQYAPPVIRAPSPSSSIGSESSQDKTSMSDRELSPDSFEKKCERRLRLNMPRAEEELANMELLVPQPKTAAEERQMFEQVMQNLRNAVRQLEDDEQFEHAMLRGTQVVQQTPATSGDLDAIMQSLMMSSPKPVAFGMAVDETDTFTLANPSKDFVVKDDIDKSMAATGRRISRRKEKRKAI